MRAKSVNEVKFERGQNPKDSMELGNENLRKFNKALNSRNYFAPVLEPMLDGLKEGSIKERDAVRFIDGAFAKYHPRRNLIWYDWWTDSGHAYWDNDLNRFFITFDLPEIDFLDITKYRKLICILMESENWVHDRHYLINSRMRIEDSPGPDVEETFAETNMFYPDDPVFKIPALIHNINKVVETTIKNMG